MIKSHQRLLNSFLVVLDIVVLSLALVLSWFIRFKLGIIQVGSWYMSFRNYMIPLLGIIPLYLLLYDALGLYKPQRTKTMDKEILGIINSNIIGILILTTLFYAFKNVHYSRYVIALFFMINTIGTIGERIVLRLILRNMRKKGYNLKYILVIGTGELSLNFSSKVRKNKEYGYNIVGFLDDDRPKEFKISNSKVLGKIQDLEEMIKKFDLDEIIIGLSIKEYDKLNTIIKTCEKYGVKAQILPDYYRFLPAKPYVDVIEDMPIINVRHVPLDDAFNKLIKRTLDVILSSIGIIILAPLLIIIAIGVRISSPGSILFKQERVGLNRRNFHMYKFRSMKVQIHEDEKVKWTIKEDPRKTKFGSFIRKTSIDELPQLFNVLKGDMSLIGPRPERPYFVEKFREEIPKYMIKHHVRPGITGWAQVNGWRGDTSIKERIKCDLYYIENWNLWLDIKIIILTIWKGFVNKNAY